jgi:hypothetical protein
MIVVLEGKEAMPLHYNAWLHVIKMNESRWINRRLDIFFFSILCFVIHTHKHLPHYGSCCRTNASNVFGIWLRYGIRYFVITVDAKHFNVIYFISGISWRDAIKVIGRSSFLFGWSKWAPESSSWRISCRKKTTTTQLEFGKKTDKQ